MDTTTAKRAIYGGALDRSLRLPPTSFPLHPASPPGYLNSLFARARRPTEYDLSFAPHLSASWPFFSSVTDWETVDQEKNVQPQRVRRIAVAAQPAAHARPVPWPTFFSRLSSLCHSLNGAFRSNKFWTGSDT